MFVWGTYIVLQWVISNMIFFQWVKMNSKNSGRYLTVGERERRQGTMGKITTFGLRTECILSDKNLRGKSRNNDL